MEKYGKIIILEIKVGYWSNNKSSVDNRYKKQRKTNIFIYKTSKQQNDELLIFPKFEASNFIQKVIKNSNKSEYFICTFFGLLHASSIFLNTFYENNSVDQI